MERITVGSLEYLGHSRLSAIATYHQDEAVRSAALLQSVKNASDSEANPETLLTLMGNANLSPEALALTMGAAIDLLTKFGQYGKIAALLKLEGMPALQAPDEILAKAVRASISICLRKENLYQHGLISIACDTSLPPHLRKEATDSTIGIIVKENAHWLLAEIAGNDKIPDDVRDAMRAEIEPLLTKIVFAARGQEDVSRVLRQMEEVISKENVQDDVKEIAARVIAGKLDKAEDYDKLEEAIGFKGLPQSAELVIERQMAKVARLVLAKRLDEWKKEKPAPEPQARSLAEGFVRPDYSPEREIEAKYFDWKRATYAKIAKNPHLSEPLRLEAGEELLALNRRLGHDNRFQYSDYYEGYPDQIRRKMGMSALKMLESGKRHSVILDFAYADDGHPFVVSEAKRIINDNLAGVVDYCVENALYGRLIQLSKDESMKDAAGLAKRNIDAAARKAISSAHKNGMIGVRELRRIAENPDICQVVRTEAEGAIPTIFESMLKETGDRSPASLSSLIEETDLVPEPYRVRAARALIEIYTQSGDAEKLWSMGKTWKTPEPVMESIKSALDLAALEFIRTCDASTAFGACKAYERCMAFVNSGEFGQDVVTAAGRALDTFAIFTAIEYEMKRNPAEIVRMITNPKLSPDTRDSIGLSFVEKTPQNETEKMLPLAEDETVPENTRNAAALKSISGDLGRWANLPMKVALNPKMPLTARSVASGMVIHTAKEFGSLKKAVDFLSSENALDGAKARMREAFPDILTSSTAIIVKELNRNDFYMALEIIDNLPQGVVLPDKELTRQTFCETFFQRMEGAGGVDFFLEATEHPAMPEALRQRAEKLVHEAGLTLFTASKPSHDLELRKKHDVYVKVTRPANVRLSA